MPSNFQEEPVSGSTYIRFNEIRISNPLNEIPMIQYLPERVTTLSSGEIIYTPLPLVQTPFNPTKEVPLLDHDTLEQTESVFTLGALYPLILSAAMQAYLERATSVQPQEPPQPPLVQQPPDPTPPPEVGLEP